MANSSFDNSTSRAFSLVELSIVILVIGILVAAITRGKDIYHQISLSAARSVTTSSTINNIPDLALWFETSLDSSFLKEENSNGSTISLWFDNNFQAVNSQKRNATQNNEANKPKYVERVFGSLPGIQFDGADDFLDYDGSFLVNSKYTLFIVEKRTSAKNVNYFFGAGSQAVTNGSLHVGYRTDTKLTLAHYRNDLDLDVSSMANQPQPKIITYMLDDAGKKIWVSGGNNPDAQNTQTSKLINNNTFWIGRAFNLYYQGYIAEILMYNRNLTDKERQKVENYLGKKYNIKTDNI